MSAKLVVAKGIDTDLFGTFTGDVPRAGSIFEVAKKKALAGMGATGLPLGIGSEGAFGPHPAVPFLAFDKETIVFVDRKRDLEVRESLGSLHTNFGSVRCRSNSDITEFLKTARFPSHALVVAPSAPAGVSVFRKGITDTETLGKAIRDACIESADGEALVTTDMRAHLNATRMAVIRKLARRLALRLATLCPACHSPGFGEREIERGAPCSNCGSPTDLPTAHVERCPTCGFAKRNPTGCWFVDPGQCAFCNP